MHRWRNPVGRALLALALSTGFVGISSAADPATAEALPMPEPPLTRVAYTPLVPARLLDTRPTEPTVDGQGRPGAPLAGSSSLTLRVLGRGGVPVSGVSAVVLNVTATNATSSTFVTVSPTGTSRPVASNLNVVAGVTVPNLVIAKVGTGGRVDVYNHAGTVDLIADVAGYFPTTDTYVALPPRRLLDTRPGEPTIDGRTAGRRTPVRANAPIDLIVTGRAGVPRTGVDSVVLNVTATNPTVDSFLTVYPKGTTRPKTSNLNLVAGSTTPNLVIAKVGTNGAVSIHNHAGTTDVIADISGYFPTGGAFVAVQPSRIFETRPNEPVGPGGTNFGQQLPQGFSFDVDVSGIAGVPPRFISAVVLNVTAVGATSDSFITVHPTGTPRPTASNLNMRRGGPPTPNLVVSKIGAGGKVTVYNHAGNTDLIVDVAGYYLADLAGIRDVDLSERSSCVLFATGPISCWGDTGHDPTNIYSADWFRPAPYDLNTFDDAIDLTVDLSHSCALRADGSVWCWASGDRWSLAGPDTPHSSVWPARKMALPRAAVGIDDGYLQTCALLDDATVWCWGRDFSHTARSTPWKVGNLSGVVQFEIGDDHACALRSGGDVRCWGTLNQYGVLGNGTGVDSPRTAVTVAGLSDADSISVQSLRSCATRTTGGAVCWGLTTDPTGFTNTPVSVLARTDGIDAPAEDIWQMDGGDEYVCALRFDDQVYCFGTEFQQNAGLGGPIGAPPDILTDPVPGLPPIAFIEADRFHMCAVSFDDELFCWGNNDHGQLGDGTFEPATEPELILSFE